MYQESDCGLRLSVRARRQPFQDATDVLPYVQLTTTDGHVTRLSASHYLPAAVSPVAAPTDATMTPAGQVP